MLTTEVMGIDKISLWFVNKDSLWDDSICWNENITINTKKDAIFVSSVNKSLNCNLKCKFLLDI